MASDHDPWTQGSANGGPNGSSGGSRPPRFPDIPPGWGGGGPTGPRPPDFDHVAEQFAARLRGFLAGGPRLLALLGLSLAGIWLATGFYRVEPDEQGLVLRFGAFNRATPPGLNYHLPWPVESALLLPVTRINRVEIGFRSEEQAEADTRPHSPTGAGEVFRPGIDRDMKEESLMLTGDENIVDINASVFWRIRDGQQYAFNTRNPGYTVQSAAESVLRQVIGHTNIQSALTGGRAAIEQAVTTGTQKILDQYGTGVDITQIQLQKVDPPGEVVESFRDVQRATTDADRARNEAQSYANDIVPRARGEAAAITAAAEGEKQSAIAAATGQAERFLSVYKAYTQAKDITLKRIYIETMEELLAHSDTTVVDDRLRGVLPMLPLGRTTGTEAGK